MKALCTAAPGEYGLVERPMPEPAADEALVKVVSAGLCHTDVIIRDGLAGHVRYPVIPGHELSGIVEACGPAVKGLQPGDRVAVESILWCGRCTPCRNGDTMGCENYDELGSKRDGGFAEYCTVPAQHLVRLPEHVTLEEAALAEPLANALSAVGQSDVKLGERVVIIGPGAIGLMAVRAARLANPSTLVLVGTRDERLALGKTFGATHTVNIKRDGALDGLKGLLGGKGADATVECAGTRSAVELALDIVGWRGRVAIEGGTATEEPVALSLHVLQERSARVMGICGWLAADFARALELLSSGIIDVKPLITHTFSLDEWEAAFDMITRRKSEAMKVMFAP